MISTASYPGKQGAQVTVLMRNGEMRSERLDDVVPATPGEIRARFRSACEGAETIENFIDDLENREDVGMLGKLLERD